MSLTPSSSRIYCFIDYQGSLVLVNDILKLGLRYRTAQSIETSETCHPQGEELKYQNDQRVKWASLPLEIRRLVYSHAYRGVFQYPQQSQIPGLAMRIYSIKYLRCHYAKSFLPPLPLGSRDDDIVIILPHALADRFVSKQWLLEMAPTIVDTRPWYFIRCEARAWKFALQSFHQPWRNDRVTTLLTHQLCSMMFPYAHIVYLLMETGGRSATHFDLSHFSTCTQLQYIQLGYSDHGNQLFWTRNSTVNETLGTVFIDRSNVSSIRKQIYIIPQAAADSLVRDFPENRVHDSDYLPDNIRTGIRNWAAISEMYQSFKAMFDGWDNHKCDSAPDFYLRVSCMIEGNSEQALVLDIRLRANGSINIHAFKSEFIMQKFKQIEQPMNQSLTVALDNFVIWPGEYTPLLQH